jgi:hypothetical protein
MAKGGIEGNESWRQYHRNEMALGGIGVALSRKRRRENSAGSVAARGNIGKAAYGIMHGGSGMAAWRGMKIIIKRAWRIGGARESAYRSEWRRKRHGVNEWRNGSE